MRAVILAFALFLAASPVASAQTIAPLPPGDDTSLSDVLERLGIDDQAADVLAARCCKTCSKGKACGDSCISRSKTCRVGPGCACDG